MSPCRLLLALTMVGGTACSSAATPAPPIVPSRAAAPPSADVVAVQTEGTPDATVFRVTVRSDDTGCAQYANGWEIRTPDGALLQWRTLGHSHTGEQPFTRSGPPVAVDPRQILWIRAHMVPNGFVGDAMTGSVSTGFRVATPPDPIHASNAPYEAPPACAW